jgi:hypothetical protein
MNECHELAAARSNEKPRPVPSAAFHLPRRSLKSGILLHDPRQTAESIARTAHRTRATIRNFTPFRHSNAGHTCQDLS